MTPANTVFEGEITEVYVPGMYGEFGVLPGHAEMITGLCTGICKFKKDTGTEEKCIVSKGVCHVALDKVNILADLVEHKKDIDAGKSRSNLEEINAKLLAPDISDEEREKLELAGAREQARIDLSSM